MIQQSHSWVYIQKKEKSNSKRYMHPSVHGSTVDNSQDKETTQCPSTDDWLKKIWYMVLEWISNEILLCSTGNYGRL